MEFLVISQRAIPNPDYSLKNLTGHGRIDIIFRTILAATRPLMDQEGSPIRCYLKGQDPKGWLTINPLWIKNTDDEISIAARIRDDWKDLFSPGSLDQCLKELSFETVFRLDESGKPLTRAFPNNALIVLGAQQDLTDDDKIALPSSIACSLGTRSLLASHAIVSLRQKNLLFDNSSKLV